MGVTKPARWLKRTVGIVAVTLTVLLLVSMFAVELTRFFITTKAAPPLALPEGVDIRYSDRLVSVLGRGTPTGRAMAVTLGSVILVPRAFDRLPPAAQQRLIRHELVHVEQRRRHGRLYLPLYGALYVLHGYADHPLEREADTEGR